jgi:biotin carboxyl carrier protein
MVRQIKVTIDEDQYVIEFLEINGSNIFVRVNGQPMDVQVSGIKPPSTLRGPKYTISSPVRLGSAHTKRAIETNSLVHGHINDPKAITAPMTGRLSRISVEIGQKILANAEICILEAMKMEQSIRASIPGFVKEIHAEEGSTVSGGDIIVQLE